MTAAATELTFDAADARLVGLRHAGRAVSLMNGPRSVPGAATKPVAVKHPETPEAQVPTPGGD